MAQRGETVTYNDKTYTYVQSRITYNGNNVTYAGSKVLPTAGRVMSTDMAIEPLAQLEEITLTSNQTIVYNGQGDGWNKITVAVPSDIHNQQKEVNPSLSDQNITADQGYSGLSSVKVNKVIVSGLDAADIANGHTVNLGFTGSPSGITVITGSYGSDASATPGDLLYGKEAYGANGKISGTIESKGAASVQTNGPTVSIPAGYYSSDVNVTVDNTAHNAPTISVNTNTGLVTAQHITSDGWVSADTSTATMQLTTQPSTTITPTTTSQIAVAANKYTIGDVLVGPIPSEYVVPTGTITISSAGTVNVTNYASASVSAASLNAPSVTTSATLTAATTGTATVTIPSGATIVQYKVTVTPSYQQVSSGYIATGSTTGASVTSDIKIPVYALN